LFGRPSLHYLLTTTFQFRARLNGLNHGLDVHGLPFEPEFHDTERILNALWQVLNAILGLELMRVLENHEILELGSSIKLEVRLFIGPEKLTDLLVKDPLIIERCLKALHLLFESFKCLVHSADLAHEQINSIHLVLKLGL